MLGLQSTLCVHLTVYAYFGYSRILYEITSLYCVEIFSNNEQLYSVLQKYSQKNQFINFGFLEKVKYSINML